MEREVGPFCESMPHLAKKHGQKTGWFFRERVVGRSRTSSFSMCHCRFQVYQRLGYCCDQPEKRCQELPEIDCEGALCKRQALALLRSERKLPTILLLCPMATLLSAQRADGAAQRECVGHRPRTRTASGVAVTLRRDGTRAGERHDGDWYHLFIAARTFRMCLVSIILVSQKRMQLRCTRMGERRWQHSRSQVRQRRQCLWAAPTRHAAAPDAQPCAAGDPRARAARWARRQAVRGA